MYKNTKGTYSPSLEGLLHRTGKLGYHGGKVTCADLNFRLLIAHRVTLLTRLRFANGVNGNIFVIFPLKVLGNLGVAHLASRDNLNPFLRN